MGILEKIGEAIRAFLRRRRAQIATLAVEEARNSLLYAFEELEEAKPQIAKEAVYVATKAFIVAQFDENFDDLVERLLDRLLGPA